MKKQKLSLSLLFFLIFGVSIAHAYTVKTTCKQELIAFTKQGFAAQKPIVSEDDIQTVDSFLQNSQGTQEETIALAKPTLVVKFPVVYPNNINHENRSFEVHLMGYDKKVSAWFGDDYDTCQVTKIFAAQRDSNGKLLSYTMFYNP